MLVDLFIPLSPFLSKVYACDSDVHSAMKGHFPVTRQRGRTDPDPIASMRILSLLLLLFGSAYADIVERPVAIIPWSQYQQRLRQQKQQSSSYSQTESEAKREKSEYYVQMPPNEFSSSRRHQTAPREDVTKVDGPQTHARRNQVIRPQIRGRVPTEPADFARHLPQPPAPQKPMFVTQPGGVHIQYPPAPPAGNSPMFRIAAAPSSRRSSAPRTTLDRATEPERSPPGTGIRMKITPSVAEHAWPPSPEDRTPTAHRAQPTSLPESTHLEVPFSGLSPSSSARSSLLHTTLGDIQIPNGVPVHAGLWENGKPNYATERRPAQHAASSVAGIDPAIPLAGLRGVSSFLDSAGAAQLGSSQLEAAQIAANQLGSVPSGNIVNSIFAQSNAQGIPSIPQLPAIAGQPNAIESFLANSGNLDAISKITTKILNAGGDPGREAGLLDIMANALKRTGLPFGSAAHDDAPPTLEASAPPKSTLMERLINQATSAINTSIKDNERKELEMKRKEALRKLAEGEAKAEENKQTPEEPKQETSTEMSTEKKNSLKLLENLPSSQREILEAAIRSGEIDEGTAASAIGALVSGDNKEESRKEKESRLMEWIKANRPTKQQQQFNVTSDKLPYFGRYCGTFFSEKIANPRFDATGGVWMADERHLVVSRFYFKPVSFLNENVTFWLGPKEATSNPMMDQIPSKNGYYVHPQRIDISIFSLEKLAPIKAKPRKGISAEVLLNGTAPVDVFKVPKTESILRSRRDALGINQDEMVPTYVPAPIPQKKPVELLVKDGIVRIMDGERIEQMNSSYQIALPNRTIDLGKGDITPEVPFGAQLLQPEQENVDYSRPQPLGWYAGFQPLLLTLPPGKKMSDLRWISLRDHTRDETVVTLLMPNDPNFAPPAPVTIRPLSSNGLFNVSSGPIHIHNMKTIEISNFTLRTNGDAVWFMIGRDILPNLSGHIVPLFDTETGSFDCDSLRDYYGETIHLRIPGQLDMRDVFWFSVFSPSKGISYSHLYLPYDHLRLPPDLKGTATATCEYSP